MLNAEVPLDPSILLYSKARVFGISYKIIISHAVYIGTYRFRASKTIKMKAELGADRSTVIPHPR